MAVWLKQGSEMLRSCVRLNSRLNTSVTQITRPALPPVPLCRRQKSIVYPPSYVPPTSLSRPPWPELPPINQEEEERKHQAVLQGVNALLQRGEYGRLFAIVHFASRQWKVTNEDLILIENHLEAECGDRIRLEKVLLVGGQEFTLIGEPLLSRELVRVEATIIEKTESWPMAHMVFRKRHRFQKKRTLAVRFITRRFIGEYDPTLETIYRHEVSIGGEVVNLEILDTAGQEEDALLMEEKIKWADGFIVVYSVTDRCSFDEVVRLCFLVSHVHGRRSCSDPPPIVIVANKKDLQFDRMVTVEEGQSLSRGLKLPLREISVRDGWEETAGVFHSLHAEIVLQMEASPPSFRRRGVSRLMEKIPRIHSNAALGSTGRSFSFSSFRDLLPD